jgi:hypothetical protein
MVVGDRMMLKPVCVACRRFFRPKTNGYKFIEGMPIKNGAPPGLTDPAQWQPYKLWNGDLWWCEGCGLEIVVGVVGPPIVEHYQDDFKEAIRHWGGDRLQVNDC